jgi:hypothetical protein
MESQDGTPMEGTKILVEEIDLKKELQNFILANI